MDGADLVARMTDYFNRQIALFESMRSDLEGVEDRLDTLDFEALGREQASHAAQASALKHELAGLLEEWESAKDVPEEDRDGIRALARRAEALAEELSVINDRAATHADARGRALRETWCELERGRRVLGKYAPGRPAAPNFIDRKA